MIGNLKLFKLILLIVTVTPTLDAFRFRTISSGVSTIWSKVSNEAENIYKKVSTPIKNLFKNGDGDSAKEHGQLDFFGRDIVRNIGKTINNAKGERSDVACKGLDTDNSFFSGIVSNFKEKVSATFPGTLWCGNGNIARATNALGLFYRTDYCCREHDNCNESLSPGERRNGLINTGLFTRSNCRCDMEFRDCLKNSDSILSHKIGFTYFTVLGPQCFKSDYPIITCNETKKGRCINYELDLNRDQYEQWFDNPTY